MQTRFDNRFLDEALYIVLLFVPVSLLLAGSVLAAAIAA